MSTYIRYPTAAGISTYADFASLPASAPDGTLAVTLDTHSIYMYNTTAIAWQLVDSTGAMLSVGTINSQTKSANGAVDASNTLVLQTADASFPGLVSTGTQTFAGAKTFSSTIAASNLSGTNTGDQTITLTSDVTGSGTGSFATTIANNAVTNAKAAQMAANTLKGNNTGSTANAVDLTVAQTNDLLANAEVDNGNSGSTKTITFTGQAPQKLTLTANCTLTFSGTTAGGYYQLKTIQGAGPYTLTWPGTVKWPAGTAPTLSAGNGAIDIFSFYYDGTNYYGTSGIGFA